MEAASSAHGVLVLFVGAIEGVVAGPAAGCDDYKKRERQGPTKKESG